MSARLATLWGQRSSSVISGNKWYGGTARMAEGVVGTAIMGRPTGGVSSGVSKGARRPMDYGWQLPPGQ